jgi:hypothetical protein
VHAVSEPVVSVEGVSMGYRLYAKPADMLREALFGGVRHDTFWALRDVSLNVYEGQRLGIIGFCVFSARNMTQSSLRNAGEAESHRPSGGLHQEGDL